MRKRRWLWLVVIGVSLVALLMIPKKIVPMIAIPLLVVVTAVVRAPRGRGRLYSTNFQAMMGELGKHEVRDEVQHRNLESIVRHDEQRALHPPQKPKRSDSPSKR